MVTLETADKALKQVYLGVVADQLNIGINPFLAKIQQTESDIWGNEIVKLVPYGLNGGVGAGDETGELPKAGGNPYERFRVELKNLYGTIELSDKAIRASKSSTGAFVNLLNAEMEGLLKASKFNLGRMLFGDGSGKLATAKAVGSDGRTVALDSVRNFMEGMIVDYYVKGATTPFKTGLRVVSVDRGAKKIVLDDATFATATEGGFFTVQGSNGKELTGLEAIFSDRDLYGLKRNAHSWLNPGSSEDMAPSSTTVQAGLDFMEEVADSQADLIVCSYDYRRKLVEELTANRINMDYMHLDGGYKALTFNGIPLVADRFAPSGTVYLLNTKDFKLHQLGDWRWLEGDGGQVIKQKAGAPAYTATLVKYADLICDKPIGQYRIHTSIEE